VSIILLIPYYRYPSLITTPDYKQILDDDDIDGVVIATQAQDHYEMVMEALSRGKNVFVEKPMVTTLKQAESMVELSEKKPSQVVMVGHLMLYHTVINYMDNMIKEGKLGDIYYLYSTRVNLGKIRNVENAVWSLAVHDIYVFMHLMKSRIKSVECQGGIFLQKNIEDVAFITLNFANGAMGHIHVGWLDPLLIRRITVVGDKQMIVFDDVSSSENLKIFNKGVTKEGWESGYTLDFQVRDGEINSPYIKKKEPLRIECEHFIECIEHGKNPVSDVRQGFEVVRVLSACDRALEQSKRIEI
ncbi:Gfo/Idh/MocA family protein, partial [Elusimicrobiota bacterium]